MYWRARDSQSDNRKSDNGKANAMNAIDTKQKILDAVDANFDAQLATTGDFVAIPSTRGAEFTFNPCGNRPRPPRCSSRNGAGWRRCRHKQ